MIKLHRKVQKQPPVGLLKCIRQETFISVLEAFLVKKQLNFSIFLGKNRSRTILIKHL